MDALSAANARDLVDQVVVGVNTVRYNSGYWFKAAQDLSANATGQSEATCQAQLKEDLVLRDTPKDVHFHTAPRPDGQGSRTFGIFTYPNGFQVHDCTTPGQFEGVVSQEGLSGVHLTTLLPDPIGEEGDVFRGERPMLAVACSHHLHLFSIPKKEVVKTLQFSSFIWGVSANTRNIVVSLSDTIVMISASTFDGEQGRLPCSPNPPPLYDGILSTAEPNTFAVDPDLPATSSANILNSSAAVPLSLGTRWCAFATPKPPPILGSSEQGGEGAGEVDYKQISKDVAKKVYGGLSYLSEVGMQAIQSYVNEGGASASGEQAVAHPDGGGAYSEDGARGTVAVVDLVEKRVVAHWTAHGDALRIVRFDPSGTLLATASVQGCYIKIWQVMPPRSTEVALPETAPLDTLSKTGSQTAVLPSESVCGKAILLYNLTRGNTPAVIQDLAFSSSRRWLFVSSAVGTVHIYNLDEGRFSGARACHLSPVRQMSCAKIRTTKQNTYANPKACFLRELPAGPSSSSGLDEVYVATMEGMLFQFTVHPKGAVDSAGKPYVVGVVQQQGSQNLARPIEPETEESLALTNGGGVGVGGTEAQGEGEGVESEPEMELTQHMLERWRQRWREEVELESMSMPKHSIWMGPQVKIRGKEDFARHHPDTCQPSTPSARVKKDVIGSPGLKGSMPSMDSITICDEAFESMKQADILHDLHSAMGSELHGVGGDRGSPERHSQPPSGHPAAAHSLSDDEDGDGWVLEGGEDTAMMHHASAGHDIPLPPPRTGSLTDSIKEGHFASKGKKEKGGSAAPAAASGEDWPGMAAAPAPSGQPAQKKGKGKKNKGQILAL